MPVGREQANEKPGPQREQQVQMPTRCRQEKGSLSEKKEKKFIGIRMATIKTQNKTKQANNK